MRHRISGYHLGRTTNQRKNLYRIQLRSLFTYGFINTTAAKAKSIAPLAEKIARAAVKADLNSRRYLFTFFQDQNVVNRIVTAFSTTFAGQAQNFTQIKNVKYRQGDNSLIVRLSFVKEVNSLPVKKEKEKKVETKKENKKITKKAIAKSVKGESASGGKKEIKK